jgi:hypothetical protein
MASHQNGERSVYARKDEENPGWPASSRPKIEAHLPAHLRRTCPHICGIFGSEKACNYPLMAGGVCPSDDA